jgi:hypothetical protein
MTAWTGVTPDQVAAAMGQYVLSPGEQVQKRRDRYVVEQLEDNY